MLNTKRYPSDLRYKFIALFCLFFVAGFAWNLTRTFTLETLFFFVLSLAVVIWSVLAMLSYVEVGADNLVLFAPLQSDRSVRFRQLISVSENGRFNPVLTLIYHPQRADGLLDLDHVQSLILPALNEQEELLELLEARLPT
ncbi:hypothetical protein BH10CHL1_BH10CHL1_13070 [soil metagenome]